MNNPIGRNRAGAVPSTISVQRFPTDNTVVQVTGDLLNNVTSAMHRIVAKELMRPPALLVVDLSGIRCIDSQAIHALASAAVIAGESDISFCLVDIAGGPVDAALAAAHLSDLFEVFPSVCEARRSAH